MPRSPRPKVKGRTQRCQPGDRQADKREGKDTTARQAEVRGIGEQISALDERVKEVDERFREVLAGIPNIPHESVPVGGSERR